MLLRKTSLSLLLCLIVSFCSAQTIQGYTFSKYPAKIYTGKKAPLNRKGSETGNMYKTEITRQYKAGKIDFGGHYITTMWGAGTGLSLGAMVDVVTGKVYDLPLSEGTAVRDRLDYGNENIFFKPNSNLFISYESSAKDESDSYVIRDYFIYKWDDTQKKFILLKNKKVTVKVVNKQ